MTVHPANRPKTATPQPAMARFLARPNASASPFRRASMRDAPARHRPALVSLKSTMNTAPAIITSGLVVACHRAAPPAKVDIDVTAATAPVVPFQSARLPAAPSNPQAATLRTNSIFVMRNMVPPGQEWRHHNVSLVGWLERGAPVSEIPKAA